MRVYITIGLFALVFAACSNSESGRRTDTSGTQVSPDTSGAADGATGAEASTSMDRADATTGSDGIDGIELTDENDASDASDISDANDGIAGVDSPLVDPNCVDGQWSEALPPANANLTPATSAYSSGKATEFILQALSIRYPTGQWIVENGLQSDGFGGQNCIDAFLGNKSSASNVIGQMSTIVHECGHFFDLDQGGFFDSAYMLTPSINSTCSGASYQGSDATFARSLIKNDEYNALRPPCDGSFATGCDSYADIYLNGDPNDSNFDSGDQAFNMLHEETTQYVNSIATGYAFSDQYQFTVSERDGILTFLWYTCRYLRMARLQYPGSYTVLTQSPCWREAILRVWGRAWLFLEATKDMQNLGISDDEIETLLTDELLQEIQLVRKAHGC